MKLKNILWCRKVQNTFLTTENRTLPSRVVLPIQQDGLSYPDRKGPIPLNPERIARPLPLKVGAKGRDLRLSPKAIFLRIAFALFFVIFAGYSYSLGEEASNPTGIDLPIPLKEGSNPTGIDLPIQQDGLSYPDRKGPIPLKEGSKKEVLITLYKGEIKVITVDNPTRVVISNPNVADVTSISKDEMLIIAKDRGTTNLIWWDSRGEHASQLEVFLENMSPVKERIDNLLKEINLPQVSTRNMDSEGRVLLLGNVKTSQDIERINVALSSFKDKLINLVRVKEEEALVGIDVQVLELNKDATATLGFSWPSSITLTETGSPGIATAGTKWSSLFKVVNLSRAAFSWTLDLLVQEGKARILSQPRLSCQSGKEAELLVGGEKPILTTTVAATTGAQGTNVEYKEFGIKLKIKPTVTEDKKIKLALNVEVSEVGTAEVIGKATEPTAKAFPLTKRSASTELFLSDGQTMAIGGLKKQKTEEDIRKTPFLGDVPILGLFFRKKTKKAGGGQGERGDVDLFITLTPTIIKEGVKKEGAEPEVEAGAPASLIEEREEKAGELKISAPVEAPKEEKETKEEDKAIIGNKGYIIRKEIPEPRPPSLEEGILKTPIPAEASALFPKAQMSPEQIRMHVLASYLQQLAQRIQDNFTYPWAAKEANLEGSLRLGLRVYWTGQLLDVEIRESSGFSVLDENAVNIVKKIAPYPAFPAEMKQKELWIDLPIIYKTK